MTKQRIEPPTRWTEDSAEPELAALFNAVQEPEPLASDELARLHARLLDRRSRSPLRRRLREALLAGTMLLCGSSLALAGWGVHDWWQARAQPAAAEAAASSSADAPNKAALRKRERANAQRPSEPVTALPEPEAVPPELPEAAPLAAPSASNKASDQKPKSADPSTLAAEAAALEAVLLKLRREHDAAGALLLLDQSQALFERGSLYLEAQVARVDALLALGRSREALSILDRLPFAQIGRGGELRLVRAELRAKDDCAHALADFDGLVMQPLAAPLAERALFGRAACELQVSDLGHAERDLQHYVERFPSGRFAARARAELARIATRTGP